MLRGSMRAVRGRDVFIQIRLEHQRTVMGAIEQRSSVDLISNRGTLRSTHSTQRVVEDEGS